MGKGGKKVDKVTLSKKDKNKMQVYLDAANPAQISVPQWGIGLWQNSHGEGRSTSTLTFHIGFLYATDTGCFWTCILLKDGKRHKPVAGTLVNWGTEQPSPSDVLEYYKNAQFPLPDPDSEPSESGWGGGAGGAGGAGGSSSGGSAWKKDVKPDGNGGYYYFDPDYQWIPCDASGNEIYYDAAEGHRTSSPRHIKAVFGPSGNTYYYSGGKKMACTLRSEKAGNMNRLVFVDAQGKKWQAHYETPSKGPASAAKTNQQQSSVSLAARPAPARPPSTRPDPARAVSTRPALAPPAQALRAPAHRAPALRPTATASPGNRSNTSLNSQSNVRHQPRVV
ncbi:uncharacterized protein C8A04DRAFT_28321 [Dichotomopilus funicola]|uniref:Uncharacterized protein n=1 Tax=Dichotomopilus funicola TaxID=1934379 RepID=A0AAN6ZMJ5_9PEZI|nr:hypothetical protein C8A04DRAFT_28321 [Dichotomopilus funicola]